MSNTVPNGWELKTVGDIGSIVTGSTPSTQEPYYWGGSIPFISPADFDVKVYIDKTTRTLSEEGAKKSRVLPENSILVTCIGSLGGMAMSSRPSVTNQQINAVVADSNQESRFHFYNILFNINELTKNAGTTTLPIINKSTFSQIDLLFPPLPEQQKIATILSSVDDVIEKTRAQINKLKDLKTGMMQELLTKGIGSGGVPHTEFKDSPVGRIPARWDVVPIDSIVSKVVDNRGKTPPLSRAGIDLLEINTISKDRINPDYRKVRKFVSPETYNGWFRAGHPKRGDILIPTVGTIGACSLVEQNRGCIAQNIIALRLCKSIDPHFAYYILSSEPTVRQIESILMNAVQPSLRVPHFLMLKIVLPSLSEQKIISASLLSIDKRLERLSGKIESLNLVKKALMQDLLTGKVRVKIDQKESAVA